VKAGRRQIAMRKVTSRRREKIGSHAGKKEHKVCGGGVPVAGKQRKEKITISNPCVGSLLRRGGKEPLLS